MKPKTFAVFFERKLDDSIDEGMGDRSVIILDGRESLRSHIDISRDECIKRGYIGFTINRGTFTNSHIVRQLEII